VTIAYRKDRSDLGRNFSVVLGRKHHLKRKVMQFFFTWIDAIYELIIRVLKWSTKTIDNESFLIGESVQSVN
jgi:hypothetical protein